LAHKTLVEDKLPTLLDGQLYICDHVCSGCIHTSLTRDKRIGDELVTDAYYCSGCELIKDAKLIVIGGKSPPLLGYEEKYVPTITGENKCWGPSPTYDKTDMGFLSATYHPTAKYRKVFYPVPKPWKAIIAKQ